MGQWTSVTAKGQVTIPKAVRDRMGLRPFDKVEFYIEEGETKLRKALPFLGDRTAWGSDGAVASAIREGSAVEQGQGVSQVQPHEALPTLAEVAGSLPPLDRPIEEAIREAKEERARRLLAKLA